MDAKLVFVDGDISQVSGELVHLPLAHNEIVESWLLNVVKIDHVTFFALFLARSVEFGHGERKVATLRVLDSREQFVGVRAQKINSKNYV